ncbi:hypothetical protein I6L81_18770 [Providencia rettgeri]|uniref:hypothetical protein n=1 Tax=Providencia rettgeri TaxID=587 RepID=UPI001C2378BA|nr:hypothetical protein [Providencia rettgeri]MCG9950685.1 hypothetical protein [Providencia rettgeri]QXB91170.1 hypothetical protein I6L81_18770 [Providencia rettgeri]
MPIELNYPVKFNQVNLLNFSSDKKNIEQFANEIVTTSNIQYSRKGICLGLAHSYIAYENEGNGLAFIENLNQMLNVSKNELPDKKKQNSYSDLAYQTHSFATLKNHFLNALKLQFNYTKSSHYKIMAKEILDTELPYRHPYETNLEYINHYLYLNKNDELLDNYSGLNSDTERLMINDFYLKIAKNVTVNQPEMPKFPEDIQNKIIKDQTLTDDEMQIFLHYAFVYCAAQYEFKTTQFNILAGITYHNNKPNNSYENIEQKWRFITRYELKKAISITVFKKEDFFAIYAAQKHATAITAKYQPTNNNYQFSFFEPNKGVFYTSDKNKLMGVIDQLPIDSPTSIVKYANLNEQEKLQPIGYIQLFQTEKDNTHRLNLQTSSKKDVQKQAKEVLAQKKVSTSLKNGNKLVFIDYNPLNDELTLSLPLGKRTFTIYSELNDIDTTIDLINASMHEYPTYKENDIYIDWKGQILNRLKKH